MNATSTGRAGLAGAGVLLALLLAACGSGGSGSSSAADHGSHDDGTSNSAVLGSDSTDSGDDSVSSDDSAGSSDDSASSSDDSSDAEDSDNDGSGDEGDGYDDDSSDSSDDGSSASVEVPSQVQATELLQFEQVQGKESWQAQEQNWAANAVVDLSDDGVFTFDTASATGIPLQGRYTVDGSLITFSGTRTTQLAAGSSTLTIEGSIDLEEHTLQFSWASSTGMAARVDGQNFAQATSSLWNATDRIGF
ncbi:hypothetical protein [Kitasatospora sp. NPDC004272]